MFYGNFTNETDVCREFGIKAVPGMLLYAHYEIGDYCGDAAVIYVSDGKVYVVEGSHCSCNGLDECWDPTEMPLAALRKVATGTGSMALAVRNVLTLFFDDHGIDESSDDEVAEVLIKLRFG